MQFSSSPSSRLEDRPRAPGVGGGEDEPVVYDEGLLVLEEMDALPFIDPFIPPLTSRIALAPKLRRRPNGELLGGPAASAVSSTALSFAGEPEPLLDELSCRGRRPLKGEV